MNIEDSRAKMIFRNERDGKVYYSIGLSKKNQDGTYTSGYINCRFPKEANIPNKTKIMLINSWLDFWVDNNKATHPYIFIYRYEIVEDEKIPTNSKTEYDDLGSDVKLEDIDLPF